MTRRFYFRDEQQDLLWLTVNRMGLVVGFNYAVGASARQFWRGAMIQNYQSACPGDKLVIRRGSQLNELRYRVERVKEWGK